MATRVRKNVYKLPAGDLTLDWYGKAIARMRGLPASDPKGWVYQGAVHGIDPPPPAPLRRFQDQCQHGTSFFLPWHRMYLVHFEEIVIEHIKALGGPEDWALPYWNPTDDPAWRSLPPEFRNPSSPLFLSQRNPRVNAGAPLSARTIAHRRALLAHPKTGPGGFFGGVRAGHFAGVFGLLEGTIHNNVHVEVGNVAGGFMRDPDLAALDPIFWLHHANIDRLWEVWLNRAASHTNLTSSYWRRGVRFDFNTAAGAILSMVSDDVLTLGRSPVDYVYDDTSDPLPAPALPSGLAAAGAGGASGGAAGAGGTSGGAAGGGSMAELVGATSTPIRLEAAMQHVELPTPVSPQEFRYKGSPPAGLAKPDSQLVERVILQLEHVTSKAKSPVYDVYINLPAETDEAPDESDQRYIGRASMFGIAKASDPSGPHAGSGQHFAFDVTDLYRSLSDAGSLQRDSLRVSFVPVEPNVTDEVSIGRISLHFE